MSTEENKAIVRRYLEESSRGNLAVVDELIAPNFVAHNPEAAPSPKGPEGQKRLITAIRETFPDFRIIPQDMIAEDDKVAVRYVVQGTQKGDYLNLPPTAKRINVAGVAIYRLEGGKIAELWSNIDTLGMMEQLGIRLQPEQAGS